MRASSFDTSRRHRKDGQPAMAGPTKQEAHRTPSAPAQSAAYPSISSSVAGVMAVPSLN